MRRAPSEVEAQVLQGQCEYCHAKSGQWCIAASGRITDALHHARYRAVHNESKRQGERRSSPLFAKDSPQLCTYEIISEVNEKLYKCVAAATWRVARYGASGNDPMSSCSKHLGDVSTAYMTRTGAEILVITTIGG